MKVNRKGKYHDINKKVLKFIKELNTNNIPLSLFSIRMYALKATEKLKIFDFRASNGWFHRLKKKYKFSNVKIIGESASADMLSAEEFINNIQQLLHDFKQEDIYNCDETGLFWKLFPDSTYKIQGI